MGWASLRDKPESDDELFGAINEWFDGKDETFYNSGIVLLHDRWARVVTSKGQYIDQKKYCSKLFDKECAKP